MRYFLLSILITLAACNRSPYISKSEISKLTGDIVEKLLKKKAYNVDNNPDNEQSIVYTTPKGKSLAIFKKRKEKFTLLRKEALGDVKLLGFKFIKTSFDYSHISMVYQKNITYYLHLLDSVKFQQKFEIKKEKLKKIQFQADPTNPRDEMLFIGETIYRYDSFRYIETLPESPLFAISKLTKNGEDSWIIMKNIGAFTDQAIITISFPDLKGKDFRKHLKLTKKIRSVKLYRPGYVLYLRDKTRRGGTYPSIEINKLSYLRNSLMRLPLFMSKEVGRILVRTVFRYRGRLYEWPLKNDNESDSMLVTDQQGYAAYEINQEIE